MIRLLKSSHTCPDNSADRTRYTQYPKGKVAGNGAVKLNEMARLSLACSSSGIFSMNSTLIASVGTLHRPTRTAKPKPAAAAAFCPSSLLGMLACSHLKVQTCI